MDTRDDWLREIARQTRHRALEADGRDDARERAVFDQQIDSLWSELQREVKRQVGIYNDEIGDPAQFIHVQLYPDIIDIRTPDGDGTSLRLARTSMFLSTVRQHVSLGGNASMPMCGFTVADSRLAFSGGTPEQMARILLMSLLR